MSKVVQERPSRNDRSAITHFLLKEGVDPAEILCDCQLMGYVRLG